MNDGQKLYGVIYADPPWRYLDATPNRAIENHYPTMSDEEICALEIPADKNCVLYLWAVAPKLPEALAVMEAWGFSFKTSAVWDKVKLGMGYWFRGQHELLLVGVRGRVSPPPSTAKNFLGHSVSAWRALTKTGLRARQDRGMVPGRRAARNVHTHQTSRLGRIRKPNRNRSVV